MNLFGFSFVFFMSKWSAGKGFWNCNQAVLLVDLLKLEVFFTHLRTSQERFFPQCRKLNRSMYQQKNKG